jgi:uncharacterized protein YjeT (DUF2065 family)
MNEFLTAIGLVLVIEGMCYALAPRRLKALMAMAERVPEETLRTGGLIALGVGFGLIWLARRVLAGP